MLLRAYTQDPTTVNMHRRSPIRSKSKFRCLLICVFAPGICCRFPCTVFCETVIIHVEVWLSCASLQLMTANLIHTASLLHPSKA
ncbi:hypothetical protein BDR03DRAFT_948774 [Suillus americanus]|nr:hypothetical protein BDR03DRAFT_948774 [Suillus americanus]